MEAIPITSMLILWVIEIGWGSGAGFSVFSSIARGRDWPFC